MHEIFKFIKKHKREIVNIITIGVIALMAYYLYKNRDTFSSLKELNIRYAIYISILQILSLFLIALNNKKVIGLLNYHISLKEAFLLQYSNSLLNKIVSEGGAVFRGVFLKEVHKLPYTKYISTIAGLYVINFITSSIMGLISLVYIYFNYDRISYLVLAFFALVLIVMIISILINPRFKNSKGNRVISWFNSTLEGWGTIKKDKKNLAIFTLLSITSLLLTTLQGIFVYKGLGYTLGFFESMYMSSLGMITTFVNITPDSIGIREGVYMFTSNIIGLESDIILLGSLIIRAIALINTFLIGGVSYLKLAPKLKGERDSK